LNAIAPVLAEHQGRLGSIELNRPAAINALTLPMIESIDAALDDFEQDDSVATVVLSGSGVRGFCAGGDIVALRASALADGAEARSFWRDEYRLNERIGGFPKPIVVLMDGIVMGGGVGLSGHASHRVVTESLSWAMPEVRIGFGPDVGGTYLLSRAPGELGTHIALTAARVGPADAIACGFADSFVPLERLGELRERLIGEDVGEAVAAAAGLGGQLPVEELTMAREAIDSCYAGDDGLAILQRLRAEQSDFCAAAAAALQGGLGMAASANINASSQSPFVTPLMTKTLGTMTAMNSSISQVKPLRCSWRMTLFQLEFMQRAAEARGVKVNPDRLAITLTQLTEGLWSGWAADPKTVSAAEGEAACHDLLDAFLPKRAAP